MTESFDVWLLLGGLGLFLFGMHLTESSLKELSGRTFKVFLRRHTENKVKAIASGALVTGLLQSSSVVSLIMLAFVGAGVVSMQNALAVVLGANLGTTLDSWVVATVGFKFEIERFAYPLIGIMGIVMVLFNQNKRILQFSLFALGVGILFLGLAFMKNSVSVLVETFDLREYASQPLIILFAVGLIVTAIIQSSSATIAITLSALHASALTFESAAAVVIGANLGTTFKLLVGAAGNHSPKKRVALGNFIFNLTVSFLAFILLQPIVYVITQTLSVKDELIGLVIFQTSMNLMGILLFFPFLKKFTAFLENRYMSKGKSAAHYINPALTKVPEAALEAMEKETERFLHHSVLFSRKAFNIRNIASESHLPGETDVTHLGLMALYDHLKELEGEILQFHSGVQEEPVSREDGERMLQLTRSVRSLMHSAKSIKDVSHDLEELHSSANEFLFEHYRGFQSQTTSFFNSAVDILQKKDQQVIFSDLATLNAGVIKNYDQFLSDIYPEIKRKLVSGVQLSTLMNINRECFLAQKSFVEGLMFLKLDRQGAALFATL